MAKNHNNAGFFLTIKNLIQAYIQRVLNVATLAGLEARLAKKTFVKILFLCGSMIILFTASWLWLSVFIFLSFLSLGLSPLLASLFIFFINVIFLIGVSIYIYKIKHNLYFPATRRQLAHFMTKLEKKV